MTDKDKIIELKIRVIELELEKQNEMHKLSLGVIVGFITFAGAVHFIEKMFGSWIQNITKIILELVEPGNPYLSLL